MTWKIYAFDFRGQQPSNECLNDPLFDPPTIGSVSEIRDMLLLALPGYKHERLSRGVEAFTSTSSSMRVEIPSQEGEQIKCFAILPDYSEGADPWTMLDAIWSTTGWSLFDTEMGEFLRMPHPLTSGLESVRSRAAAIVQKLKHPS